MRIVLDSSAVLAFLLDEPGGDAIPPVIDDAVVSTVNLAEIVAVLSRGGNADDEVRAIVADLAIAAIVPDEAMALDAGFLRETTRKAGLSLGDRFCLALARRLDAPVLTADRAWSEVAGETQTEVRLVR